MHFWTYITCRQHWTICYAIEFKQKVQNISSILSFLTLEFLKNRREFHGNFIPSSHPFFVFVPSNLQDCNMSDMATNRSNRWGPFPPDASGRWSYSFCRDPSTHKGHTETQIPLLQKLPFLSFFQSLEAKIHSFATLQRLKKNMANHRPEKPTKSRWAFRNRPPSLFFCKGTCMFMAARSKTRRHWFKYSSEILRSA